MIHLDTNFLIASLSPPTAESRQVSQWLSSGETVGLSVVTWAEFLCGPLTPGQAAIASAAFPDPIDLIPEDAARAAELFNANGRRRGSLADCLIAATCLRLGAAIATNNLHDFKRFVPLGLRVVSAAL
jgi:predicted nucleic acid-binding protein